MSVTSSRQLLSPSPTPSVSASDLRVDSRCPWPPGEIRRDRRRERGHRVLGGLDVDAEAEVARRRRPSPDRCSRPPPRRARVREVATGKELREIRDRARARERDEIGTAIAGEERRRVRGFGRHDGAIRGDVVDERAGGTQALGQHACARPRARASNTPLPATPRATSASATASARYSRGVSATFRPRAAMTPPPSRVRSPRSRRRRARGRRVRAPAGDRRTPRRRAGS